MWVPGSETEMVIVTDTFVKIYDLRIDLLCLLYVYYFVVLTGKIRDATIVATNEVLLYMYMCVCMCVCLRVCVHVHMRVSTRVPVGSVLCCAGICGHIVWQLLVCVGCQW